MRTQYRSWLRAATAAVGAGALTIGGVVLPASAEEPQDTQDQAQSVVESGPQDSATEAPAEEAAEQASGELVELQSNSIAEAAARNPEFSEAEIEAGVESGELQVSVGGHLAILDPGIPDEVAGQLSEAAAPEDFEVSGTAPIPGDPAGGSRPGAPVTIYLDFGGLTLENTGWNAPPAPGEPPTLSYDIAGAQLGNDPDFVAAVWAAVAEDYAPFNVNVTTTDPGADALYKTSDDDETYGSHLVITDSTPDFSQFPGTTDIAGGFAFTGGAGSDYLTPAFVFTEGLGGAENANWKSVADAAAHEVGHQFGLAHDGFEHGNGNAAEDEYYMPLELDEEGNFVSGGLWGPTMGAPYYSPLTQWSAGDYANATNTEDDLSIITDRGAADHSLAGLVDEAGDFWFYGFCVWPPVEPGNIQIGDVVYMPVNDSCDEQGAELTAVGTYTDRADYIADDHGNDSASATSLDNADGTFTADGVISGTDDVDVFAVTTAGGEFTATVNVAEIGATLDAKLTLTDASGTEVATAEPETTAPYIDLAEGLDATITQSDLAAGTYYLTVDGVGQGSGDSATAEGAYGYSDYGSLGNYTLTGEAAPFDAEPLVITDPEDGADVTGSETVTVTGTGEPGATITLTGDVTTTVDADGYWVAEVPVNQFGETVIEASQQIDGVNIGSGSVTVVAEVPAPVITTPANDATTNANPGFAGTGIPGATVELTIVAGGETFTATAEVDADGVWGAVLDAALAAGDYTVTGVQTINGVTSDASDAVAFTVEATDDGNGGNGNGNDGNGNDLVNTGGTGLAPLGFAALGLLILGAAAMAFSIRQRKLAEKAE